MPVIGVNEGEPRPAMEFGARVTQDVLPCRIERDKLAIKADTPKHFRGTLQKMAGFNGIVCKMRHVRPL